MKVEGAPYLCKTDEVGEICVHSSATGTAYYGLLGITKSVFEVRTFPTVVLRLRSVSVPAAWACALVRSLLGVVSARELWAVGRSPGSARGWGVAGDRRPPGHRARETPAVGWPVPHQGSLTLLAGG